ncbi:hypothetical protein [Jatrophihabitans sp.]|uniref:hypothetical protein n=1 Tax=Jatrophihabitans sp. TaxID=1932789 RepID=UPI0030C66F86|nr:hypothetical protein [Jatrophihabitans sp.]
MEPYTGFEPQVGEIRAVRTFRIGPDGLLYPLFSDVPWLPGTNTARCNAVSLGSQFPSGLLGSLDPAADTAHRPHETPEPDCTCGYYAYASERAAQEYPNARHVLAVVACWGRVIAGTRGIRTEHGRVEALWMSATVPADLAGSVAQRYGAVAVYADKELMLREHPPTALDCYEVEGPELRGRRALVRVTVVAALVLGLIPHAWLSGNRDLLLVWLVEVVVFVAVAFSARGRSGIAARRRSVQSIALVLWLLAPFGGVAGTLLLRIPVIQLTSLILAQRRALSREANRFPARIASLGWEGGR